MLIRAGDLVVDTDAKSAEVGGMPLRLTTKEYRILELLSLHKGTAISRVAILEHLYPDPEDRPEPKMIDVFVAVLRKKLADASGRPGRDYLTEIGGRGVKLNDASAGMAKK